MPAHALRSGLGWSLALVLAVAACSCPSSQPATEAGLDLCVDLQRNDRGPPDLVQPDRRDLSVVPDRGPGPDAQPPPQQVLVSSDKVIAQLGSDVRFHVWWGQDHVIVGSRWFRRISGSGQVLAEKLLPNRPGTNIPVQVASMAAGKKGIAAIFGDGANARLALVKPDGTFAASSDVLGPAGNPLVVLGVTATPAGFAVVEHWYQSTFGDSLRLALADHDAKLLDKPVEVAKHGAMAIQAAPDGRISYMTPSLVGLQHGLMKPDPAAPADTLSASLATHELKGPCAGQYHVTTTSGVTWVGSGDTKPLGGYYLVYNVEKGGKALFPSMQQLSPGGSYLSCIGDVATDEKRFLVIYGVEQTHPVHPQLHWKAQIYGLDGKPVGPAQDLPLQPSTMVALPGWAGARARLVWTGSDFVLFYFEQVMYGGFMHMARLTIKQN